MTVRRVRAGLEAAGRRLWALHAPIVLALFAAAGFAAADDYGLTWDEPFQRQTGEIVAAYVLDGDDALFGYEDRAYGPAFELPLLFAERLLGLEDGPDVWRTRRLLTHLFFLAGGFFAWLLAFRLTGSRPVALFAMLMFLLHPRIWAHSFFNPKDVPALAMFMVCLFLIHRAFRKDTLPAFLLAGAGVGLLTGIRLPGLLLFAAVPALRALDLAFAANGSERRRAAATGAAFALAAAATLYAVWPWLWTDPLARFAEAYGSLSQRVVVGDGFDLFRGSPIRQDDPPPDYVPWWVAITTPPFVLLLGLAGGAAALYGAARRPLGALRNTDARFALLLVACLALPVLFVVFRGSTLYNDWRHVYFLYAPFSALAALGLHRLALAARRCGPGGPYAVYALAAAGAAATILAMALVHPYQPVHFNLLVDRTTPGWLRSQYEMDYWNTSLRSAVGWLLESRPGEVSIEPHWGWALRNLPPEDRERVVLSETPDFRVRVRDPQWPAFAPLRAVWQGEAYGSAVVAVYEADASLDARWREGYASAAEGRPALRSVYDVRVEGRTLTYLRDGCGPEHEAAFFVHVYPEDPADLPRWSRADGLDRRGFAFRDRGVRHGGRCVAAFGLPEYGVARVRTGQLGHRNAEVWAGAFPSDPEGWLARADSLAAREPLARGEAFGVHLEGRTLTWVSAGCSEEDAAARIFLHVAPADAADLPEARRASGFDNLDFAFGDRGLRYEGRCMASAALPDYAIARVATGRFTPEGEVWRAEFAVPP